MRNPFARRSPWAGIDYLDLVPRHRCAWEDDPGTGRVVVQQPRYTDPLGRRLIQPRLGPDKRHLRIPLEARGSFLWRRVDGATPVRDLIAPFLAAFPDEADDVERRVSLYLQAMYDNKLIAFVNLSS